MIGNMLFTRQDSDSEQDIHDPDDAPDLASPEWQAKLAAQSVRRGRPPAATTKVSTTIRLDADILLHFRASGPGWQSRMNAALRAAITER